jgi:hypothetical protein
MENVIHEEPLETGSPLTADIDVSQEAEIIWVRGGPDDYPYLREWATTAGTRARPIRNLGDTLVAYAALRPDAPGISRGRFRRRVWSYQFGRDGNLSPMQGVRPHSISAGRRSERM